MSHSSSDNSCDFVATIKRRVNMIKQPEITDATRKSIMSAFWELYKTTRIEQIKISTIADNAHVHRSTFYRYFNDIYDLLSQLENEELQLISNDVSSAINANILLDLNVWAEMLPELLTHHAEKVYYLVRPHGDPDFQIRLRELLKPYIMPQLESSQYPLEKDYLFTFAFNLMLTNFNYWFEHQDTHTLKVITDLSKKIVSQIY